MDFRSVRTVAPLAALALIHAVVASSATYALTWVGHTLGRRLLPLWGIATSIGFLLDNANLLSITPTPPNIVSWNWVGVGLALAATAFAARD